LAGGTVTNENSFSGYRSVSPTLVTEGSAELDDRTITKRRVFYSQGETMEHQNYVGNI